MQRCFYFLKTDFSKFFQLMSNFGPVHAPKQLSEESFAFQLVTSPLEIAFQATRTFLPPKKFFFPPWEKLLSYRNGEFKENKPELTPQVLFGVHPCDLMGLGIIEKIFLADPPDCQWAERREATLIIGLSCMPDKYCFCNNMGSGTPSGNYDVFLTDLETEYFVQVNSERGLTFAGRGDFLKPADTRHRDAAKEFWNKRDECFVNSFNGENLPAVMDMEWDSQLWKDYGERCLSCGNCTMVCPTCYCFDMVDNMCLDGEGGHRCRQWDSCQFYGFAKVAGNFNFRATSVDRYKFWFRHKLHGFEDPYGLKACVGCGRCWVYCPADIDNIPEIATKLLGKSTK